MRLDYSGHIFCNKSQYHVSLTNHTCHFTRPNNTQTGKLLFSKKFYPITTRHQAKPKPCITSIVLHETPHYSKNNHTHTHIVIKIQKREPKPTLRNQSLKRSRFHPSKPITKTIPSAVIAIISLYVFTISLPLLKPRVRFVVVLVDTYGEAALSNITERMNHSTATIN